MAPPSYRLEHEQSQKAFGSSLGPTRQHFFLFAGAHERT